MSGVFAPGRTPAALINRLNEEIVRVLSRTDIREKLLATGLEATAGPPQQFTATIRSEVARLAKLVKETGIRGGE
jgi:tripartite-type tricarboxylate transporter receptor subunit TctC